MLLFHCRQSITVHNDPSFFRMHNMGAARSTLTGTQVVAQAKFQSKIDLLSTYKQLRVELADVWKTTFVMIYGVYVSNVLQQGDCNGPLSFQRLMNWVF